MIFKKKINLVNTTSSKELPLGLSHKLISRAHCEMFCSIFCIHIWHLSWNIGDFCTNYLRWEIQYLWDLPLSLWTNQRQEQQFPGKMNEKVCPKCSVSSFHNQLETWIPPRARICVAPAYLRVYNVAGWIFPVFLLMIIRVIGDRKFSKFCQKNSFGWTVFWYTDDKHGESLWYDGRGW